MQVCISVTQNVFSLCEQAFRVSSEEYFIFIWAYLLVFGVLYQPDWSMGIDLCTSYIATQHIYFYQLANNWSLLPSLWGISKLRKKTVGLLYALQNDTEIEDAVFADLRVRLGSYEVVASRDHKQENCFWRPHLV